MVRQGRPRSAHLAQTDLGAADHTRNLQCGTCRSLYRWRKGATPDVRDYVALATDMLRSVGFLHSRGLVHR